MSPAPGTKLGPYTLMAALGSGGMGEVFTALDTRLDRLVALKLLPSHLESDPAARARFDREARAIAGLNHPNVCALFDVGQDQGHRFLVMELLEGATLQERLQQGPLEIGPLITYAIAIADALDAAHAQGLIHRDLKPANIFITTRDVPKILDFGLAKTMEAADDSTRQSEALVTSLGTTVGTLAYMSPEQLKAEPLDARTDLFSFGLVLYEMATGQRAFTGQTTAVISAGILGHDAAPPRSRRPDLPPRLEDTILKAIEKDRGLRCQTAAELRADLMRIKRELSEVGRSVATIPIVPAPPMAAPAPATSHPATWNTQVSSSSRMPFLAGVAVLLVVVAAGSTYWFTRPPAEAGTSPTASAVPTPQVPPASPPVANTPPPAPSAPALPPARASSTPAPVTLPPAPATQPPAQAPPPAGDARGDSTSRSGTGSNRARGGRGPFGPAGTQLVTTLRGMPAQNYHIMFAAGNVQARELAFQLQGLLNAGGWVSSGVQPVQDTPAPFAVGLPRQSAPARAFVNWATRNGFTPDVRVLNQLKEIRIIVGAAKQ